MDTSKGVFSPDFDSTVLVPWSERVKIAKSQVTYANIVYKEWTAPRIMHGFGWAMEINLHAKYQFQFPWLLLILDIGLLRLSFPTVANYRFGILLVKIMQTKLINRKLHVSYAGYTCWCWCLNKTDTSFFIHLR